MSVVVTARVPDDLAAWADEYAGSRDVPRAVIVEAALGHFRGLCAGGVPELPEARSKGRPRKVEQTPEPTPIRAAVNPRKSSVTKEEYAELMRERDQILAEARATVVRRES